MAGTYSLPLHEGTYSLLPTSEEAISPARLVMNTRGGDQLYDHMALEYAGAQVYFDSGWYSWFADVTTSDRLHTHRR